MKSILVGLFIAAFTFGSLGSAEAAGGKFGCSLYYALRLDGTEITYTNISLRNLASKGNMTVEKVEIYQSDGGLAASGRRRGSKLHCPSP